MELSNQEEEDFREACCFGDADKVNMLINKQVDINSQNHMNKWTGLHWACKRNHVHIVRLLMSQGANPNLTNITNQTPADLTRDMEILNLLQREQQISVDGSNSDQESEPSTLSEEEEKFVPSYLKHSIRVKDTLAQSKQKSVNIESSDTISNHTNNRQALVFKIRVADTGDPDFIEVEFFKNNLSYSSLLTNCCEELNVNPQMVERIRKLPNTRLRNDKDINRLENYQELEFIVKGKSKKVPSSTHNSTSIHNFQTRTILY